MILRELSNEQYVALGVLPMSRFAPEKREQINAEASASVPPPRWFPPRNEGPLFRHEQRSWFEWHVRRHGDPRLKRAKLSPVLKTLVIETKGMVCAICGLTIASTGELHIDHILPVVRGGRDCVENLQPTHALCNLRKGAAWREVSPE